MAGEHFGQAQEKSCRIYNTVIAYWLDMSRITCKWFGCCGIAKRVSKWNWGELKKIGAEAMLGRSGGWGPRESVLLDGFVVGVEGGLC